MTYFTKNMKKALDYLNTHEPDLQRRFYTLSGLPFLFETIDALVANGYADYADRWQSCIRVSERGRSYKEIRRAESLAYLKDKLFSFIGGFVSGVLVSVVTAFILSKTTFG